LTETSPPTRRTIGVGDIKYVPTQRGYLYLTATVDAFSRRVVGWAMEGHLRTELMLQALNLAIGQCGRRA